MPYIKKKRVCSVLDCKKKCYFLDSVENPTEFMLCPEHTKIWQIKMKEVESFLVEGNTEGFEKGFEDGVKKEHERWLNKKNKGSN